MGKLYDSIEQLWEQLWQDFEATLGPHVDYNSDCVAERTSALRTAYDSFYSGLYTLSSPLQTKQSVIGPSHKNED